jgi:hypothetical protein
MTFNRRLPLPIVEDIDLAIFQIQICTPEFEFKFEDELYFIKCFSNRSQRDCFFIGFGPKSDFDNIASYAPQVYGAKAGSKEMRSHCLTSKGDFIKILRDLKTEEVVDG